MSVPGRTSPRRRDQARDLLRKLLLRMPRIECADVGFQPLSAIRLRPLFEIDQRLKGDKFTQGRHVYAVAVGIADRRSRRCDDNAARPETVQHRQNRVLHRVAADDRIVQDDQRVRPGTNKPVGDIVDMLIELPPRRRIGDERAEFRVLDRDLSESDGVSLGKTLRPERFQQSVERNLRRIGDVAEEGILEIAADGV